MKKYAAFHIIGAGVVAAIQWWQIAYRLRLFYADYHAEKGVNHIGDLDFILIYIANSLLLFTTILALREFRHDRNWRTAAVMVGSLNLLGWLTLFVMHKTGVLVEYGEFLQHVRSMRH